MQERDPISDHLGASLAAKRIWGIHGAHEVTKSATTKLSRARTV
jgi:hypothetical protein